jgi:hypothetical protein
MWLRVVPGFRREVLDENCALLGYYAASSGKSLPMFQDNLSAPSSGGQKSKKENSWLFMMGQIGSPETSGRNYQYSLPNNPV